MRAIANDMGKGVSGVTATGDSRANTEGDSESEENSKVTVTGECEGDSDGLGQG